MSGDIVCTKSPGTITLHKLYLNEIHLDHIEQGGCLYACYSKKKKNCELVLEEAHCLTALVSQFGGFLVVKLM